jgi:putative lipoprotein
VKKTVLITIVLLFALLALAACTSDDESTVSGNIVSKESVTLPDGANIQVQIQDVSVADAPAKVIGEQNIDGGGESLPIPYEVSYDPSDIDDRFTYSMSVRIEDADGNLIYISDTNTPVITNGNPTENVNINVVPVAPSSSSGSIHNIEWQWRELSGMAVSPAQTIPDPENYTIIFREDGTFNGRADCNNISGTYTNEGGRFTISLGPSTMAACEPDSLDQEYLRLLSSVAAGGSSGPDLALEIAGGAERMTFTNGGAAP